MAPRRYMAVLLLAVVVGLCIVFCLLACALPDELGDLMGWKKKQDETKKAAAEVKDKQPKDDAKDK